MTEKSSNRASAQHTPDSAEGVGMPTDGRPVLFFDGVCGLCNRSVDFILSRDSSKRFWFAPLQGDTAAQLLGTAATQSLDSVVLLDRETCYRRSTAAVRVLWKLGGIWKMWAGLLWLIPRPVRDVGYRAIAKSRYRLFGKKESCRLPTPAERSQFLP